MKSLTERLDSGPVIDGAGARFAGWSLRECPDHLHPLEREAWRDGWLAVDWCARRLCSVADMGARLFEADADYRFFRAKRSAAPLRA